MSSRSASSPPSARIQRDTSSNHASYTARNSGTGPGTGLPVGGACFTLAACVVGEVRSNTNDEGGAVTGTFMKK
jgi:hypothetical protein